MDPSDAASPPPVLPPPSRAISGFWRRILALLLDGVVLAVVGGVSGFFLFDFYAGLGGWGRLLGFAVALTYYGVYNSSLGRGATIGKRMAGIEVVDAKGDYISPTRSCMRYLALGVPFFLNGAAIRTAGPAAFVGYLVGLLVFGLGGAIAYLYIFNRRTRQSVHDLAVGTYVTRAPGSGSPHVMPIWRGHMVFLGIWCLSAVGFLFLAPSLVSRLSAIAPFPDLLAVQQRILASANVSWATVVAGKNWNYHNGAGTETTFLQVTARMKHRPDDYGAAANEVAAMVLASYPAIYEKDLLIVTIAFGYDIGIAQASITKNFQHSPEEWVGIVGKGNKTQGVPSSPTVLLRLGEAPLYAGA